LAVALSIAVLAAGCGSGGSDGSETAAPSTVAGVAQVEAALDDFQRGAAGASVAIVTRLGGVGGFAAVLLAIDRGYVDDQVVAYADRLEADGDIPGTKPALEPQGHFVLPSGRDDTGDDGEDEGALGGKVRVVPASFRNGAASSTGQPAADPTRAALEGLDLVIGDVHRDAAWAGYLDEMGWDRDQFEPVPPGATAEEMTLLGVVLALARRGYSSVQILIGIAAGDLRLDSPHPACLAIDGEMPDGPDLYADCDALSGRTPDGVDTGESSSTSLVAPPSSSEPPGDDEAETTTYRLAADDESLSTWRRDGEVLENRLELTVTDEEVVAVEYAYAVRGFSSETGAGGRVICQSDATASLTSDGPAPLVDGTAEVAVTYRIDQTAGVPMTDDPCDEASALSVPAIARVTVEGDTATLDLITEGEVGATVTLTR
jgi:hypothetical protein